MRMIDRWFPCTVVSDASHKPHGSGQTEKALFTWFATRPIAQARAAVMTTLLPWPEDQREQERLQRLVIEAIQGNSEALKNVAKEIHRTHPEGARILDPFSGRAVIPLEAIRVGVEAWGIDYSPVATLGGMLLSDFPFRNWSTEPAFTFPFKTEKHEELLDDSEKNGKLYRDLREVLDEIGRRQELAMDEFYPKNRQGKRPWGYLWAQTMPCDECKHRFPMVGSAILRKGIVSQSDPGACFSFFADRSSGQITIIIHEGISSAAPTLLTPAGKRGKIARCPFCMHPHSLDVIKAKAQAGFLKDMLLLIAEIDPTIGLVFRLPTQQDLEAVIQADRTLEAEEVFHNMVPAVPHETIPAGNNDTVRGSLYGARTYGDLCNGRQTLSFVRLCRIIADLQSELLEYGLSDEYIRALLGYAGAVVVRKLRYSTRGATLRPANKTVDHIFKNQASLNYGFDFLETGVGYGPGTWRSLISHTLHIVGKLCNEPAVRSAHIRQGSALHLPFRPKSITAVVTDPPYYNMIDYSDVTDLFFVWLKRALGNVFPEFFDVVGVQMKEEEIIVKRGGLPSDHRTSTFYTTALRDSFTKIRSLLSDDGAMTLVFSHGDPKAWVLLLSALMEARFVVTGSWPAHTEASNGAGSASVVFTFTIACHSAPNQRPNGLQAVVDLEVQQEIFARIPDWERSGLSITDQVMAAYGPAMEVIGQYERVLRPDTTSVKIEHYLSLARSAVQEAAAIKVDGLPLETFDARTRFALFWVRLHGRQFAPKSEALFQAMVYNLRLDDVRRNILEENSKGYRLAEFENDNPNTENSKLNSTSAVVDVVRYMVRQWRVDGNKGVACVFEEAERMLDDTYLWAVISDLSRILPPADKDRKSLEDILRNRRAIQATTEKDYKSDFFQPLLFQDHDKR